MHVCVLGAGIVGLATAYELTERGFQVTVVDGASTVGSGASGANGAQLSYSYVQPLADASIWAQLPKLLLSPSSPLKVRPQWDIHQWRWCLAFLSACNKTTSAQTTTSLLTLAAQSRAGLDALRARESIDCDYSNTGKLVFYSTKKSLAQAQTQMQLQQAMGSEQQLLSANACVALEPALSAYQGKIEGAIHTPSECAIDAFKLCLALEKILRAKGVRFELGSAVHRLAIQKNRIVSADTTDHSTRADQFVLALGSGSARLARKVHVPLPVYPIKGYSVTFDLSKIDSSKLNEIPRVNVTDSAQKIVFARLGDRLRVAGIAELVGDDQNIDTNAITKLVAASRALFPQLKNSEIIQTWAGLRPATPTGLPIVGRAKTGPSNLIVNTGHGALGLTLAFGTAHQVAALWKS